MMVLGELLSKAKTIKVDDKALIKKLRAMLQTSEDQLQSKNRAQGSKLLVNATDC
jgi:hypothetical protein